MILGNLAKGCKLAGAGIRKDDVERAFLRLHRRIKLVDVRRFRYVALDARHVTADLVHRCIQFAFPAARDEYMRTVVDEPLCRGEPDPAAASGNHCDLPCELL